jgi:hypothetical protein
LNHADRETAAERVVYRDGDDLADVALSDALEQLVAATGEGQSASPATIVEKLSTSSPIPAGAHELRPSRLRAGRRG